MQAIESATLTPQTYFSLENNQGSVAQATLAELIVLNANPLQDIKNTTKLSAVIKSGVLIDRAALDGLLEPK